MFGIDYAWGRPSIAALKKAGVQFVCRYLAPPGASTNGKLLTLSEARQLRAAGIDIVAVWESTSGRALAGYNAGREDALEAKRQLLACGGGNAPIYFAVDFDATEAQQNAINSYFDGVASALGSHRAGAYGGYWVIKRLFDQKDLISYGWQTYAWSGGQWDKRAKLQQYSNDHTIDGVSVDYNHGWGEFGQWGAHAPPEAPGDRPLPGPVPKPKWYWDALKEFLARRKKH